MVRIAGDALSREVIIVSSAKSTTKPQNKVTKKRGKKANRTGWHKPKKVPKNPGFNAFEVKETDVAPDGRVMVISKVVAPETGIHSCDWALKIKPQGGFLALPAEVRNQIFSHVFDGLIVNNPRRRGLKFTTVRAENNAIDLYNELASLSRQTYVDVVGGSLLYKYARFSFSSPDAMIRYINCINPAHRNSISHIHLAVAPNASFSNIPLSTLGGLPSLTDLSITFRCHMSQCSLVYIPSPNLTLRELRNPYHCFLHREVMARLVEATWGDLEGLSSFDASFELLDERHHPSSHRGWSGVQHKWHLEFIKQVKKIVVRKVE